MSRISIAVTVQHYPDVFTMDDAVDFDNYEINTQGLIAPQDANAQSLFVTDEEMTSTLTFITDKTEAECKRIFESATIAYKGEVLDIISVKS